MAKGDNLLDGIMTEDSYLKHKDTLKADWEIAEMYNVGYQTLRRWKAKHDIKVGQQLVKSRAEQNQIVSETQ